MAIQFVGAKTGTGTGATITLDLTSLTGGIGSSAAAGDVVLVISGWASSSDANPGPTTDGYTEIADLFSDSTVDANLSVAYKRMGSTPDTSVSVSASNSASYGSGAVAYIFRGVDETTPVDVTTTTSTGNGSSTANAPSITPTTSGAYIVACMASAVLGNATSYTGPSGMSGFVQALSDASTVDFVASAAYYAWTSGAYDPAALTGGTSAATDSWAAATVALRPAPLPKLYWVVYDSSLSAPSATQVKAGQDVNGDAADASGNEDSPTTTTEPFDFTDSVTGLTASTEYKAAVVWSDGTNNSNVAVSAAFSTTGGGATTYTHTASLSAAIQQARSATASLQAAIQAPQFVTASADAAIAQARTASADLQAAIQQARTATSSTDAAIVAAMSLEASLDAYIQALAERYARPEADVSDGSWLPSTPGDLYAMLDEETASDTDYIYTETASTCVIRMSDVADPGTSANHVMRYRVRSAEGSTLIATLKQGATTIATRTHSALGTDWTTLEMNLSGAETDAITDYTDLTVTLEAQA